ncbi:MAG TPA: S8 family serine peptidase, partial [Anaerolineae bacterium]
MGTVAGDDGGSNQVGMAPGAKWIGCRNMNVGVGQPSTYLECFEFFLAPYPVTGTVAMGDPSKAPDVTINSWSCPASEGCSWNTLQAAVEAQRAAGIMTVVAATNSGPSCSTIQDPPSLYDAAYTVGALNTGTDGIAGFSSLGPVIADGSNRRKPDIAAPGSNVRSSERGNTYGSMSGTSMATPNVAGAVALLWSARPSLKNQITATEEILNNSAVHIATTACSSSGWPNNVYGYGRLDVKAAVASLGFALTPYRVSRSGYAGNVVSYTVWVTNTSLVTDTIDLAQGSSDWAASTVPTTTGSVAAGTGIAFS